MRDKGGWILPSALSIASLPVPPLRLSLFPLKTILSIGSQCESVTIIYIHTHMQIHYTTDTFSHSVRRMSVSLIGSEMRCWCF